MAKKEAVRQQLLDELIDEIAEDCQSPEDLLGNNGIIKQLTSRLLSRKKVVTTDYGLEGSAQSLRDYVRGSSPFTVAWKGHLHKVLDTSRPHD